MRGQAAGFDELGIAHNKLVFHENILEIERTTPTGDIIFDNISLINSNGVYEMYIGSFVNGEIHIDFDNFVICSEELEPSLDDRVSLLESLVGSLQGTINNILDKIDDIFNKLDNHESRIISLENQSNNSTPNYFKYLNANERKDIVCGYAEDKHLTNYSDLGWNCNLTYKLLNNGKENVNCKCSKV